MVLLLTLAGPFAMSSSQAVAAEHGVFWCDWKPAPATAAPSAEDRARRALCSGDADGARKSLAALRPGMEQRKGDGSVWVDFYRTYFYALVASHHDADAFSLLTAPDAGQPPWKPANAERLFWSGDDAGSFAALVADDAQFGAGDPGDHKRNPQLDVVLAALRAHDNAAALTAMQTDKDAGSLYDLMRGDLFAQQRNWQQAFAFWKAAAEDEPLSPQIEFSSLDTWNAEALDMLYYYRAHVPTEPPAGS